MKEQKLDNLYDRLNNYINILLENNKHLLDKYKSNYILNNPKVLYETKVDKLNILKENLNKSITNIMNNNSTKINTLKLKVDLLNPNNILDKGYSIVYKDGKIIKDIKDIKENDTITTRLSKGTITSIVKETK